MDPVCILIFIMYHDVYGMYVIIDYVSRWIQYVYYYWLRNYVSRRIRYVFHYLLCITMYPECILLFIMYHHRSSMYLVIDYVNMYHSRYLFIDYVSR